MNWWKDTAEVGKLSPEQLNSYSVVTVTLMRKEQRRTLINSGVAGHKVPLMMLGIKNACDHLKSMGRQGPRIN